MSECIRHYFLSHIQYRNIKDFIFFVCSQFKKKTKTEFFSVIIASLLPQCPLHMIVSAVTSVCHRKESKHINFPSFFFLFSFLNTFCNWQERFHEGGICNLIYEHWSEIFRGVFVRVMDLLPKRSKFNLQVSNIFLSSLIVFCFMILSLKWFILL